MVSSLTKLMIPAISSLLLLQLLHCATRAQAADCGPGTFKKGAKCQECPAGTYQPYLNAAKCRACPANTFTAATGVVDGSLCQRCPLDTFSKPGSWKCTACPAGKVRASASATACRACRAAECKPCPKGFARFDAAGCQRVPKCRAGFVPPPPAASYFPDSTCVAPDTGCPKGLRLFGFFRRAVCMNAAGAVVCPANHVFDGVDRCLSCATGMRIVKSNGPRLQCGVCDGYSVSKGGVSKVCKKCPNNLYKSLDGAKCLTLQQLINSLKAAFWRGCRLHKDRYRDVDAALTIL